jgi:hypothetical protein
MRSHVAANQLEKILRHGNNGTGCDHKMTKDYQSSDGLILYEAATKIR